jgi:hypothetical protein
MPVHNLNIRQAKFIKAYIETNDPAEAAIRSGYSPNGALQTGRRLLKNAHIDRALGLASQRAVDRVSTTLDRAVGTEEWIVERLVEIIEDQENTQQRDRIASLSLLSKRLASFRDPSILVQNQHNQIVIPDGTSIEDLRNLKESLRRERLSSPE